MARHISNGLLEKRSGRPGLEYRAARDIQRTSTLMTLMAGITTVPKDFMESLTQARLMQSSEQKVNEYIVSKNKYISSTATPRS